MIISVVLVDPDPGGLHNARTQIVNKLTDFCRSVGHLYRLVDIFCNICLSFFIDQRGKLVRKVAASTLHGVHLFLEISDDIEYL